jgi:hypothetical protein
MYYISLVLMFICGLLFGILNAYALGYLVDKFKKQASPPVNHGYNILAHREVGKLGIDVKRSNPDTLLHLKILTQVYKVYNNMEEKLIRSSVHIRGQ